ncbi:PREDICTED: FHA domain-containing protein DDL-like isoform X2 [Ipomoea nil]|uniref:FHA domain-containing protein DDL-like isoform X2 n=1 Tax=Ipomoea nil TaxID=35883 RepID=UPI0009011FC2|nr:PREDICTED: FHA domain-containing protein DDL-like isoform X2 [Ipomoea nil]
MGRNDSKSPPARRRGSPSRRSSSHRERSPVRQRSSHGVDKPSSRNRSPKRVRSRSPASHSPVREKPSTRNRSPKRLRSTSPESSPKMEKSRSPSPRTRRLMRVQAEKEAEREHDKNHGKGGDRTRHPEKDSDRHEPIERRERRSGRDSYNNGSSKSRHERSASPDHSHRRQHRSRSPAVTNRRERDEGTHTRGDDHRNNDNDSLTKMKAAEEALQAKEKVQEKPSFELSGKLAAETNRVRGITLLFNEPPDARKPDVRWRLYVLKSGEVFNEPLYVHRQSCYLFGRERRVADIPTDHPSCSKQHAVLQYRQVEKENPDGTLSKQVRPYIMDLGSTNGTFINDNRIEAQRYYELLEKDTIKFGNSSREYVLLHENSAG